MDIRAEELNMPNIPGTYDVVIVNRTEPEHEVAGRLLEIADEKGYDVRAVEASRGDHDAALSFRVPKDVAEQFNAERADLWPTKIENNGEDDSDQDVPAVNEDAFAADNRRRAEAARAANTETDDSDEEPIDTSIPVEADADADADDEDTTPPVRKARPAKSKE